MAAATPTAIKGTSITQPTADPANHKIVLGQLKETTEIAQRQRGDPNDSFVRVSELLNVTGAKLVNGTIQPPTATTSSSTGGTVSVQDSISGTGAAGSPLQLVNDTASPGNNKLYGTNGSGMLGWYAQPSAGTSNPFNITPDTHGAIPTGVGLGPNDEFEGATFDTAGSRYSGATAWTWQQQGSSVATLSSGALALAGQLVSSNTISAIEQPLSGSSWTFQAKCSFQGGLGGSAQPFAGLHLRESSSGKVTGFGFFATDLGQLILATGTLTGGYSSVAVNSNCAYFSSGGIGNYITPYLYYQISLASGNIVYSVSQSGLPGTFLVFTSRALTTDFTTAPDHIGFAVRANNTTDTPIVNADWFRRAA